MRKNILFSSLITILLLVGVYFVASGLVEGRYGRETFYNVTDAAGNRCSDNGCAWWNYITNYSGNTSISLSGNSNALYFNFSLNHSSTVEFNGNITNITITFPNLFQLDVNSMRGNITPCVNYTINPVVPAVTFNQNTSLSTIIFFNGTQAGLTNRTGGGSAYSNCTFAVNLTVNGTGNTNTEITGTITINASNSSNTNTRNLLSFTVGVDSLAPRITGINITDGTVTQRLGTGTTKVYLTNSSNLTVKFTLTDANLWNDTTYRFVNASIWWNMTGAATIGKGSNQTNATNITSCTFAQGASGCVFQATLPKNLGAFSSEGGNISFIIVASDYFLLTSNDTNSQRAYNVTFDNTATDCEITIPEGRFIIYREHTVSCTGDINETRLYESESDVEICKDYNSCTGTYAPQTSGTRTLRCETKDNAGNSNSCEKEVSIASREAIYAGEVAAPAAAPAALDISTEAQTTGLSTKQSTTFRYGTIDHTIAIDAITSDSVTLTIDNKISATIPVTESKDFDLDADGNNDIKVTLNRILLNKADITVEKLAGATVEPEKEVIEEEETSLAWLWWVLIAIVVIVIIYLVVSARKKK